MLLYCDYEENASRKQGVSQMMSKEARKSLIRNLMDPESSRHYSKKKEGITMNVTECYVLTNDSNKDDKDQF
ncbi:unnamed protein product [Schistosoma mattheei]|uniref:Uncharacterized protein n=1 Tax=Schistosoma mattheei TaxID=31246 RepID=A0A183P2W1_9TREM|nr:unnamed protein product [Schistosoma mattheei]